MVSRRYKEKRAEEWNVGIAETVPDVPPSALPGISPTRGEIGWGSRREAISPLVGEMSGRTEGGTTYENAVPQPAHFIKLKSRTAPLSALVANAA